MNGRDLDTLSLADLETRLARARASAGDKKPGAVGRLQRVARDGAPLVASYEEQRLWFLSQLSSHGYHVALAWRLVGALNREALRRALNRIVDRHESLRTTFEFVDGELLRRIAPEGLELTLTEHDLRGSADVSVALEEL